MGLSKPQQEAMVQFAYLWKTDDEVWLKKRKEEWRYLSRQTFNTCGAKEKKLYADYFVKGLREDYIPECTQFFLTPIDSAETAKRFFYSGMFSAKNRQKLMGSFIWIATKYGSGISWKRQQIQYFIEGILGKEFRLLEEKEGRDMTTYSPDPTFWCVTYVSAADAVLSGEMDYHGCIDAIDYFVSALRYADRSEWQSKRYTVEKLLALVDEVLSLSDSSDVARSFAQKLKERELEVRENWALSASIKQGA